MKINQKYHNLEDNELINKAGRVCKFSEKFHCYCRYYKIINKSFKKINKNKRFKNKSFI